jgi:putative sporulation protein YyaC
MIGTIKPQLAGGNRFHIEHPYAKELFSLALMRFLTGEVSSKEVVVVCIGTDRSTGDSLGPLVGSQLAARGIGPVYGTLDDPVHATNLQEKIVEIREKHPDSFIVAIDACLGKTESVGHVNIKKGPLRPGTGVNKNLPTIGNMHIVGIVNVGGFMEYFVLQNTRLNLVMKMATLIADGIGWAIGSLQKANRASECASSMEFQDLAFSPPLG